MGRLLLPLWSEVLKIPKTKRSHKWYQLFHDRGPYHIETSPLICRANQWTGFYMIGTFAR